VAVGIVCAAGLAAAPAAGQSAQAPAAMITRAVEFEQAARWREAIAAWRAVLDLGDAVQGVLGLERVFTQLQQEDSVIAVLDTLLPKMPANRVLRAAQLRTLRSLGRDADARAAFAAWVRASPVDPAPYRDYAAQLIGDGRVAQADTVLRLAAATLGSSKDLMVEVAQLNVALGRWAQGAAAWREAMEREPYLEQTAQYSLGKTPASQRDSVRAALAAPPANAPAPHARSSVAGASAALAPAPARKVLGMLELQWGNARDGWRVLATLTMADSAWDTWSDFASEAERQGAWIAARDALSAMYAARPATPLLLRSARAAVSGGDPASAVPLLARARSLLEPEAVRRDVLPLEVRALSQLGRAADAEALVAREPLLDAVTRQVFARQIAWGWVRAGQVEKARAALAGASSDDDEEVSGWIALFDGDFRRARAGLRRPADATGDVVTAMALLGRTTADSSRAVGAAFLVLARGDTAQAAARFERAADELSDAAPLLLAFAARLRIAKRQDGAAIALWQRILQRHATSPEAAEADLEWARTLRRRGDVAGAVERLEHLILSYPQSALVPQARRELEGLRGGAAA
jgi:tetratricopeptide (TPR) repeat protein